jgi:hypothetical protein
VYGEILRNCDLDLLSGEVFRNFSSRVCGIAYADDLAMMGMDGGPLQECLCVVEDSMLPFNLRINAGKTQVLVFLPFRRIIPISEVRPWCYFYVCKEWIEVVEEFKYLGIFFDISTRNDAHVAVCSTRARQAAIQIGRLCRQLEVVNFSRLRTYFFSFVVSQFHGYQMVTFPNELYESALMLFFRTCFSLPVGFPRAIFYYFAGALEFEAQQILGRFRFFQKHARTRGFMRSVFFEDRRLFLMNQPCWSRDFMHLYEDFLPGRAFSELDLFDPHEDLRALLETESSERRDARLSLMPSGVLFRSLVPYRVMPSFLRELSARSFEEVRLVLIFFANMFRFCFLSRATDVCPLCLGRFISEHIFDCPEIQSTMPLRIDGWRDLAFGQEWRDFLDLFFIVCFMWTRRVNSVRVGHTKTITSAIRLFLG